MSLKLNYSNSRALEGSRARQRTCFEPNFKFCVFFSDNKSNLGHADKQWPHNVAINHVIPLHSASKYDVTWTERKVLRAPQRTYAVPNLEFLVPSLPSIPTWRRGAKGSFV